MKTNEMSYDVIIIGGGLSGLTAGAFLSKKGKKVILLEQHSTVGGLAAGFTRKGYYFDSGISRFVLASSYGIWEQLGIIKKVEFKPQKNSFLVNGYHFSYTSIKSLFDELAKLFPEEGQGISSFYHDQIKRMEVFFDAVLKIGNPAMYSGLKKLSVNFRFICQLPKIGLSDLMFSIKATSLKADDILKKYLNENGAAYTFLMKYLHYQGLSLFMFVGGFFSGMYNTYPSCGFQGLSNELAKIITLNQGEVITNAKVKRIIIENQTAIGIEYIHKGKDEKIFAEKLISAIDLKKSFFQLVGENFLDKEFSSALKKQNMSEPFSIIYLGLNVPTKKLREYLFNNPELIYAPDIKSNNKLPISWDHYNPILNIHSSAIHNPLHAPENKANLQIYLYSSMPENSWGIMNGKKTDEYKQIKNIIINRVLEYLEKIIPDMKNKSVIEVCELGTPYTFERYTGNTGGSSCGFTWDINENKINGGIGTFLSQYDNIQNLFFIGHQTGYQGGVTNALLSAKNIIRKI